MAKVSVWRVGGGDGSEGADHGIDGKILFPEDPKASKAEQIIIQIKGGKTGVKDMRDLRGVLDREKAAMGVPISLQPPAREMVAEAVSVGCYEHKAIQELTHCTAGTYIEIQVTSAATAVGYAIHLGDTPGLHQSVIRNTPSARAGRSRGRGGLMGNPSK